jgi:hypothetical protein
VLNFLSSFPQHAYAAIKVHADSFITEVFRLHLDRRGKANSHTCVTYRFERAQNEALASETWGEIIKYDVQEVVHPDS